MYFCLILTYFGENTTSPKRISGWICYLRHIQTIQVKYTSYTSQIYKLYKSKSSQIKQIDLYKNVPNSYLNALYPIWHDACRIELKWLFFVIHSQQKTHGRVAKNQAWSHAAQIVWPSRHALHCVLYSVAHSYFCAACLWVQLHKEKSAR